MSERAAASASDEQAQALRRGLLRWGWVAAAVVVVVTFLSGLPTSAADRALLLGALVVGILLWLLVLSRWVTGVAAVPGCLVAMGLAGAVMDVVQPHGAGFVVGYMAIAAIGLMLPRGPAAVAGGVVLLGVASAEASGSANPLAAVLDIALGAGFLFAASAFAAVNRESSENARELLRQEELARAAQAEAAVLGERQRLARELHDVLAHTLSGLAVQLEGARLLAERAATDPRLLEQVTTAQRLARDGMANAKRAVSTLRGEPVEGPGDLADLVQQVRSATGMVVDLAVEGTAREVPAQTGLAIYRAVQEALTNAAKYAGTGARVRVRLRYAHDGVSVQIRDLGAVAAQRSGPQAVAEPGPHPVVLPSGGFGLAGLAERAALAGGRLDAGPVTGGAGWQVALHLPLDDVDDGRGRA